MSVGVLLITHDEIGRSLVDSLQQMLGNLPLPVSVLSVSNDCEPLKSCYHAENLCQSLNQGDGVLVLTDLFGATPCNIACSLMNNCQVRVVCGVNFPMLVKVMNYATADLDTLASKALSGGCQGILDVSSVLGTG